MPDPTKADDKVFSFADFRDRIESGSSTEHPEHRIPGGSLERDLHRGEAVQAVFGFRFEEHREGITAALLSGEDLVAIQLSAHRARGQDDFAIRSLWPGQGTDWFNSQLLHLTRLALAALAGGKSMPVQHPNQRFKRAR